MRYKSKVDIWFYVVLMAFSAVTAGFVLDAIVSRNSVSLVMASAFALAEGFLVLPIWLNTAYTLEEYALHVTSGLCKDIVIPYDSILHVSPARNAQSCAALSLDRLDIAYNTGTHSGSVLISPRDKEGFLHELYVRML